MELSKGIALFVGWLSGALAGIGAILYACGYLLSTAQLHLLGLSGLVNYGQERYVEEGGRFLIDVLGLLGEILLNLLISAGFVALLVLLVLAPLGYFMRRRLGRRGHAGTRVWRRCGNQGGHGRWYSPRCWPF